MESTIVKGMYSLDADFDAYDVMTEMATLFGFVFCLFGTFRVPWAFGFARHCSGLVPNPTFLGEGWETQFVPPRSNRLLVLRNKLIELLLVRK